jgi:hypothetical protein
MALSEEKIGAHGLILISVWFLEVLVLIIELDQIRDITDTAGIVGETSIVSGEFPLRIDVSAGTSAVGTNLP